MNNATNQYLPDLPEPPRFDPFSRPGDGFGDSQFRQQQYESLLKQAGSGDDITRHQRQAMLLGAAGLMAPGIQQGNFDASIFKIATTELPGLSQIAQPPARTPMFDLSSALPAYQRLGQGRWKDGDDQGDDEDRRMIGILDPRHPLNQFLV